MSQKKSSKLYNLLLFQELTFVSTTVIGEYWVCVSGINRQYDDRKCEYKRGVCHSHGKGARRKWKPVMKKVDGN